MMKYLTIADDLDNIRLSAIWDFNSKKYTMPSLEIFKGGESIYYADNELWLIETLLPALQRFENRMMVSGDDKILEEVLSRFVTIYDKIQAVPAMIEVIQLSIANGLLNTEQEVQVSDTTEAEQNYKS